jgi:hypothetical protein
VEMGVDSCRHTFPQKLISDENLIFLSRLSIDVKHFVSGIYKVISELQKEPIDMHAEKI